MEVIISARHFEVSEELRGYIEEKMARLGEEYGKLTTVRVVLSLERNWQVAEGHVAGKHLDLEATASTDDMYASVDELFGKLEKQLRKYLEKMQDHRKVKPLCELEEAAVENEVQAEELAVQ